MLGPLVSEGLVVSETFMRTRTKCPCSRAGASVVLYSHDLGMAMLIGTSSDNTYGYVAILGVECHSGPWGFKVSRID